MVQDSNEVTLEGDIDDDIEWSP